MAKEWVKEARNDAMNKAHLHVKVKKSLGAVKQKSKELASKLIIEEKERMSAETRLKNAQVQAEDQRKLLYQTEMELATQGQLVLKLKSELQKAKEASQAEKVAAKAAKQASYLLSIEETEIRLAEELAEACRDYCKVSWEKALNLAGVPADSK